jgi:hypothetical protein
VAMSTLGLLKNLRFRMRKIRKKEMIHAIRESEEKNPQGTECFILLGWVEDRSPHQQDDGTKCEAPDCQKF